MCWGTSQERQWRLMTIRRRDGWRCWLCGGDFHKRNGKGRATIDHAIPKGRGGSNHISNLRLAHEQCNSERGMIAETPPRAARLRLLSIPRVFAGTEV